MIHTVAWRVAAPAALDFWAVRLEGAGAAPDRRSEGLLTVSDPEGLGLALVVTEVQEPPLRAQASEIPAEHALLGFDGARAYSRDPGASTGLLEALGFEPGSTSLWTARGEQRSADFAYDEPPAERGVQGAGTVHHIAWASQDSEHEAWRGVVSQAGAHPTPVIDRQYFRSIYFREPSGVLFELATFGPGFAVDEEPEHLGESLRLPPQHEHLRDQLERTLTPLHDPRARERAAS
jgi:glyoxalase family protein